MWVGGEGVVPAWLPSNYPSSVTREVRFLSRLCHSHPSQCGPFILCCGGVVQLAFRSFSDGIVPYVAIYLLCSWEEVSAGFFYMVMSNSPQRRCTLNSVPKMNYFRKLLTFYNDDNGKNAQNN